jgi:hypothetical protein
MLVTDMNARERARFAEKADRLAKHTGKLAAALRAGDDVEVLLQLAITGIAGEFIVELGKIFTDAVGVQIPETPEGLSAPVGKDQNK